MTQQVRIDPHKTMEIVKEVAQFMADRRYPTAEALIALSEMVGRLIVDTFPGTNLVRASAVEAATKHIQDTVHIGERARYGAQPGDESSILLP